MMAKIDDFETIKKAFDELDYNHDGMLTLKDFKIAKEKNLIDFGKLEEVVLQIDLDGDGKIDF